jgi:threonine dehydratase
MDRNLGLAQIEQARQRLAGRIIHTPLLRCARLDEALGCRVHLKPEMFQLTGSFKARGAFNRALQLDRGQLDRGLISSSSGNHAQALAYVGRQLGAKATLVIPVDAPKAKIERTRAMGAEVILFEGGQAERWAFVHDLARERGAALVHAFDDPEVMAGQGTLALEILDDLPEVDTVVVPLGGGGLLSGVATAVKGRCPQVQVIGVEPASAPKYCVSRGNGRPTHVPAGASIADGVRAEMACAFAHGIFQKHVDAIVTVDEDAIVQALRAVVEEARLLAEGAAVVGIAAALSGRIRFVSGERVCFVLSGGNWGFGQVAAVLG